MTIPGLRAEDLNRPELPSLRRIMSEGASGWMLCRAARASDPRLLLADGRDTPGSLLLSLNSGARALALPETEVLPIGTNSASDVILPPDRLRLLLARNRALEYPVSIGALGEMARRAGGMTAFVADRAATPDEPPTFLLGTDAAGRVNLRRDACTALDEASPYGVRADTIKMLLATLEAQRAALLVVAFHDLDRADRYAPLCLPEVASEHRTAALRRLNFLLGGLRSWLESAQQARPTLLFLFAPAPPASSDDRLNRIAPLVMWGAGIPSSRTSAIRSDSTRRIGLALNTDLLASAAAFWGERLPPGATGRPLRTVAASSPAASPEVRMRAEFSHLIRTARQQSVLGGLPTVQMCLTLCGLLMWRRGWVRLAHAISASIISLPLGMLVLPLLHSPNVLSAALLLAGWVMVWAGVAAWAAVRRTACWPLALLCGALIFLLCADMLLGSRLLRDAWMSYSVMEGARFYGLGNEYMGALVGAACVLMAVCREKVGEGGESNGKSLQHTVRVSLILAAFVLFVLITLVLFGFSADFGSLPAAVAAFGGMLLAWRRGRMNLRGVTLLVGVALVLLGAGAGWDLSRPATQQTHVARALSGAGGGDLAQVAGRKLAMEARLLVRSPWSLTCWTALGGVLWMRRRVCMGVVGEAAVQGLLAGAVVAILTNDSGLLSAALMLLYAVALRLIASVERTNTALNAMPPISRQPHDKVS